MPLSKIVIYFTPDLKETGRVEWFNFDRSRDKTRGVYELSLKDPSFINGSCSCLKSDIKSTASLIFKSRILGDEAEDVFKVNDYFEIWDTGDPDEDFCYFRGVVKQTSSSYQGDRRSFTLTIENAGEWALGDNSIYYLRELVIIKGGASADFFKTIKTEYGWNVDGTNTPSLTNIKTPASLIDVLVNQIANVRTRLLREKFYNGSDAIKPIEIKVGNELTSGEIYITDKLSSIQGSIIDALRNFEGRPFCEIFLIETEKASRLIWRNTRIRDFKNMLCMGDIAGDPENEVTLFTDQKEKITRVSPGGIYKNKKEFSGILSQTGNRSNDEVINAIFVHPLGRQVSKNVPSIVVSQVDFDEIKAQKILSLDSIIRHGYKPKDIELPFIPDYLTDAEYNNAGKDERAATRNANVNLLGQYLTKYTGYAYSMYQNIQNSMNGATAFQNNLHISLADDFKIATTRDKPDMYINVHKITWHFDPTEPRTVLEWDRGFKNV